MQLRDLEMERRDARTVVAIILGGGAGTRLFPLTKRRAKPAVSVMTSSLYLRPSLEFVLYYSDKHKGPTLGS